MNKTMEVIYEINGQDVTEDFSCNKFPAGEDFIRSNYGTNNKFYNIDVFFVEKNSTDILMKIGQKVDILRSKNCGKISVVIPYLPYSRQDRYTTENDSFALKVFAQFINSMNLHRVYTVDAHSNVSGVINNLVDLPITPIIDEILTEETNDSHVEILSPDAGASKKISKFIAELGWVDAMYSAEKIRNVTTGDIVDIKINGELNKNKKTFIIDDICDGGRTFTSLSDLIKGEKILYVTHGIFSKDDVFKKFSKVYTTDSYSTNPKAKIIKLKFGN